MEITIKNRDTGETHKEKIMTQIHGVRICRHCKGICHKGSWRKAYGERKEYFCCGSHLRNSISFEFADQDWPEIRDRFFEQVDVITA